MSNHLPDDINIPDQLNNIATFPGSSGSDTINITFEPSTVIATALLSGEATGGPDGSTDTVNVDGAAIDAGATLPEGQTFRIASLVEFGPEDKLNINNIDGGQATVALFGDLGGLPTLPTGEAVGSVSVITFDTAGSIVLFNSSSTAPFENQEDFNARVEFTAGGTPDFLDLPSLSEILQDFQQNGTLPTEEIPGVFELPDDPQPGDTVDIPDITIEIGGQPVTFNPGDPFWFDNIPAKAREALLADPEIAVGYDYRLANPADGQAFATLNAPSVNGDSSYNLVVFDQNGDAQATQQINAGTTIDLEDEYNFPVTNFIIEGIDPEANLDPDNATAFPLEVSFAQDGDVDMQQTPLVRGFEFRGETDADVANTVSAFYTGYYGRAADPGGFDFWTDAVQSRLDAGQNLNAILEEVSSRFRDENETTNLYPFLDRDGSTEVTDQAADDFVTNVYQNLFNRAPEQAGLDFWSDEVVQRVQNDESIADIITTIVRSATGNDAVAVGNKISVSTQYAQSFTAEEIGTSGVPDPNDILDDVDQTDASTNSARGEIEAAAEAQGSSAVNAVGTSSQQDDAFAA